MTVIEQLLHGERLYLENQEQYFSTIFYHQTLPFQMKLQDNSLDWSEPLTHLYVHISDKNDSRYVKVYKNEKGFYFNLFNQDIYIDELIKK